MDIFLRILAILLAYGAVVATGFLILRIRALRRQAEGLLGRKYTLLEILVPKNNEKGPLAAENMFAALHGIFDPQAFVQEKIVFEIAARAGQILFYVYVPSHLRDFVEGQIYAQYPTVEISEVADYSNDDLQEKHFLSTELSLTKPDVFPIKTFLNFEVDPLAGITGVLSKLTPNEQVWIQLVVRPVSDDWKERGISYVNVLRSGGRPGSHFGRELSARLLDFGTLLLKSVAGRTTETTAETKEAELSGPEEAAAKGIETKVTKLGFETQIRVIGVGESQEVVANRVMGVVGAFKQFNMTNLNGFQAINPSSLPESLADYRHRSIQRGYILNIQELASIYHLPNITVETPTIAWAGSKKGEPPANLPIEGSVLADQLTLFGETNFRHLIHRFGIKNLDRRLHFYAIGKTGTGKSTMLENMIIDDIHQGRGVTVVDPHGDLITHILDFIPSERIEDVVWFAPWDRDFPIGFNPLESVDLDLQSIVASGVVGIFKKIFGESWGPRLEYILRNAVLSLLEYPNATLLGVTRVLTDKEFRKDVIDHLKDPVVRDFWLNEFEKYDPKFRIEAVAPIQNKVGQFLSTPTIRNIVGQPTSTISLSEIMDRKKILLLDLSIGKIGEDTSALLGAMMITKMQIAALSRAHTPEDERIDHYLYVDEFQNFATESFAVILSEARKYRLNLIMTNQFIAQMPEVVSKAVFGNVGTIVTFRVGPQDANLLVKEFEPVFEVNDLINLDNYSVYVKMSIDGVTSVPFSAKTLPPDRQRFDNKERVVERSRSVFSKKRTEVENQINRWSLPFRVRSSQDKGEPRRDDERWTDEPRLQPIKPVDELSGSSGEAGQVTKTSTLPKKSIAALGPKSFEEFMDAKGQRWFAPLGSLPSPEGYEQFRKPERVDHEAKEKMLTVQSKAGRDLTNRSAKKPAVTAFDQIPTSLQASDEKDMRLKKDADEPSDAGLIQPGETIRIAD